MPTKKPFTSPPQPDNNIDKMRHRVISIIVGVGLVLILGYFIGAYIANRPHYFAKIYNTKVSKERFEEALRISEGLSKFKYFRIYDSLSDQLDFEQITWDRIILTHNAQKRGLKVSDKEVIDFIAAMPIFYRGGIFDSFYYKTFVRNRFFITPTEFETGIRETILIDKYADGFKDQLTIHENDIKNEFYFQNSRIEFDYVVLPYEQLVPDYTPTDEEIINYYNDHQMDFVEPETIRVQYIKMNFPPDGGIQKEVETKFKAIGIYNDHITKKSLKKALPKFNKNKTYTVEKSDFFGIINPDPFISWTPEISKTIFKLDLNQLAEPIELEDGYVLIKLIDRKGAQLLPLEQVRERIIGEIKAMNHPDVAQSAAIAFHQNIAQQVTNIKPEDLEIKPNTTVQNDEKTSPFQISFAPLSNLNALIGTDDGTSNDSPTSDPNANLNLQQFNDLSLMDANEPIAPMPQSIPLLKKALENLNLTEIEVQLIPSVSLREASNILDIETNDQQRLKEYIHTSDKTIFEPIYTSRGVILMHIKKFTPSTDRLYEEKIEGSRKRIMNNIKNIRFEKHKDELIETADFHYLL